MIERIGILRSTGLRIMKLMEGKDVAYELTVVRDIGLAAQTCVVLRWWTSMLRVYLRSAPATLPIKQRSRRTSTYLYPGE